MVSIKSHCGSCFSLRSKRFRLVSEQKETVEGDFRFWPREKQYENHPPPLSFICAIFCVVFHSCSLFFAPKRHRNACYAGYSCFNVIVFFNFFCKKRLSKTCLTVSAVLTHFRPPNNPHLDLIYLTGKPIPGTKVEQLCLRWQRGPNATFS